MKKRDYMDEHNYWSRYIQRGGYLADVPENHRTYELCFVAIKNGEDLLYVPAQHRTYEMCLEAIKRGGWIGNVPDGLRAAIKTKLGL